MSSENNPLPAAVDRMREDALERVRDTWEDIAHLSKLPLKVINRGYSPADRYRTKFEFTRQLFSRAEAVTSFAVRVGLITPVQALQVPREFFETHPEFTTGRWGPRAGQDRSNDR